VLTSRELYVGFVLLLGAERLFELALSARNARWARAQGALEFGREHLPAMKALHTALFVGAVLEVTLLGRPFIPALGIPCLVLVGLAQGLRYWAVSTLGRRWNITVLVLPGVPAEAGGPFRIVRHPNYLAVVVEGLAIPLVHAAYITAAAFTICNALLLRVRIRCEERALAEHCGYGERLGDRGRLIPARSSRA
jgi:methyltransferase